ncbi:MAG: carbohydrate binding family 9 domain-containing protein [Candidatus Aminicenantes bacterium]|nr:carbohydrate binding family 9 domain-containing protein [Candidatus Aminicenantes bacterium]
MRSHTTGSLIGSGLIMTLAIGAAAFSAPQAAEPAIVPRTDKPPVIDGILDDEAWTTAFKAEGFKTFQPDFGRDPAQKSEGYMTYDAENFYFALRCFDREPDKIKASVNKRDAMFEDDFAGVLIDTFNDTQSAFGFLVNPLGIQGDGMMDINGNLAADYDMVWSSAGRISKEEGAYTVEIRVPLKSLRFPNRPEISMRLGFFRQLIRDSEMSSYPDWHPDKGSVLGQMLPIRVSGLKYHRVVEILPALTHSSRYGHAEGVLAREERDTDFSLTAKVGLTSDLTADATYNPDFSQVEADAGQVDVNLRYNLYFPEKRPFFLEGNELWQFAGNTEDAPLVLAVHTRTIINPLFGLKLSGKLTSRDTLAAIYARDDLPSDDVDAHPDFAIFRLKHALKGDSYLGGFYTGREYGRGFNRFGGLDGRFRLSNTSVASFHLFGSLTKENGAETVEPGHALALAYNHSTRRVNFWVGYQDVSKDFRVDTGFLMRTGMRRLAVFGMYSFYPQSKFFQKIEPFYWSSHIYDTHDRMFETLNIFVLRFWMPRSTMFRLEGLLGNEVYSGGRFDRSAFGAQLGTQLTKHVLLYLFARHGGAIYYDPDDPYQGYGNRVSLSANLQPTDKLAFSLDLTYADFFRKTTREKIYDYTIARSWNTYQINKYLFLRAIFEYNNYRKRLTADALVSFTYIPGTVVYAGYGSAFQKLEWDGQDYVDSDRYLETKRGFFFKVSYLWRL